MTAPTRRSSAGRAVVVAAVVPVVIVAVVVAAVVVGIKFSTSVPAREAAQKGQKTLAALPDSSAVNSAASAAVEESQEAVAGLPDSSAANSTAFAAVHEGEDSFGGLPPAVQATLRAARDFSRLSLEDMLKQAQTAKDLTRLTSDQYLRQNPNMAGYKPARGNGKTLAELEKANVGPALRIGTEDHFPCRSISPSLFAVMGHGLIPLRADGKRHVFSIGAEKDIACSGQFPSGHRRTGTERAAVDGPETETVRVSA